MNTAMVIKVFCVFRNGLSYYVNVELADTEML